MKDILLVGKGKASKLHTSCYDKSGYVINKYYADIDEGIEEVITKNNLDKSNLIIDIVTPKEVFLDIIDTCERLGLYDIIIEKPFVVEDDFFLKHPKLKIIMVQNYMYSSVTNYVKKYLEDNKLVVKSISTNFSKNRISESLSGRGMVSKVTENYEIEVPHQVYICDYLLNNRSELLMLYQLPMVSDGVRLEKLGYGFSIMKNKDVSIVHTCDLTSNTLHKDFGVLCEDGYAIMVKYSTYDKELQCLNNGKVEVYKDGEKILEEAMFDDMMTYCLKYYYEVFNNGTYSDIYKKRILDFSKTMNEFKEFSSKYC